MKKIRRCLSIIIISLALNICIWCFSIFFIKNLGNIIELFNEELFAAIFSQLEQGSIIVPPFVLPTTLLSIVLLLLFKKNNKHLLIKIPLIIVFVLVLLSVRKERLLCY